MDALRWLRNQWDRGIAIAAGLAGGVALLLGWLGMARTVFPAEQLPYIVSGGLAGLFLLGIGATAWLSADLRDEWRKLDRLEDLDREPASLSLPWEAAASAGSDFSVVHDAREHRIGSAEDNVGSRR